MEINVNVLLIVLAVLVLGVLNYLKGAKAAPSPTAEEPTAPPPKSSQSLGDVFSKWVNLWPESWASVVAVGLLLGALYLAHSYDPNIPLLDIGILQYIPLTILIVMLFNTATWLGIEFNFPDLWRYYKDVVQEESEPGARTYGKHAILLGMYAFLMLMMVLVFTALT